MAGSAMDARNIDLEQGNGNKWNSSGDKNLGQGKTRFEDLVTLFGN